MLRAFDNPACVHAARFAVAVSARIFMRDSCPSAFQRVFRCAQCPRKRSEKFRDFATRRTHCFDGGDGAAALPSLTRMSRRGDVNKLVPGAHPSFPNGSKTALMSAAETGNSAKIARLVDEDKADVGVVNEHGLTALHFASTAEAVRALVERGADLHAKARDSAYARSKPLDIAIRHDNAAVIKELAAQGADVDGEGGSVPPLCRCFGWRQGPIKAKALAALLAAGADVNGGGGVPPLLRAIDWCNLEAVRILCEAGADIGLKYGYHGQQACTPLASAIRRLGEGHAITQ